MKNIPIVFVHEGGQSYLKKTIRLAEKYNTNVYLIGDEHNKKFCNNWIGNTSLNQEQYRHFSSIYKHMSTNGHQFELNCFKRFYLLDDLMRKKHFEDCIMLDSDLCAYVNFSELGLKQYDVALAMPKEQEPYRWCASTHCSYWTVNSLEDFIQFFENVYTNQLDLLLEKWEWHQNNNISGGICDMTLLYLWIKDRKYSWLNLAQTYRNMVFDLNIAMDGNYISDTFVMDNKCHLKKVRFHNQKPWFKLKKNGRKIQGATIHASGDRKKYIPVFYECSNYLLAYKVADWWAFCKKRIRHILNMITKTP